VFAEQELVNRGSWEEYLNISVWEVAEEDSVNNLTSRLCVAEDIFWYFHYYWTVDWISVRIAVQNLHVLKKVLCWRWLWTGVNRITYWFHVVASLPNKCPPSSSPLDNIRVMVIVWRLRGNIIRTAPCWVVWHSVHNQQHTHMNSSYRSSILGLSHWDAYTMHRGGCLELYYCNMVECCWWNSSLICKTNWFLSRCM